MKLETIFARNDTIAHGALLTVRYNEEDKYNAWDGLIQRLDDAEYLHDFFCQHAQKLRSQRPTVSDVETAISRAKEELYDLEEFFFDLAQKKNRDSTYDKLIELFQPLNKNNPDLGNVASEKAYGRKHNRWLRVYAIRIVPDVYIITGGALKLWQTMQEQESTYRELRRLRQVRDWLKHVGIIDIESTEELEGL